MRRTSHATRTVSLHVRALVLRCVSTPQFASNCTALLVSRTPTTQLAVIVIQAFFSVPPACRIMVDSCMKFVVSPLIATRSRNQCLYALDNHTSAAARAKRLESAADECFSRHRRMRVRPSRRLSLQGERRTLVLSLIELRSIRLYRPSNCLLTECAPRLNQTLTFIRNH